MGLRICFGGNGFWWGRAVFQRTRRREGATLKTSFGAQFSGVVGLWRDGRQRTIDRWAQKLVAGWLRKDHSWMIRRQEGFRNIFFPEIKL